MFNEWLAGPRLGRGFGGLSQGTSPSAWERIGTRSQGLSATGLLEGNTHRSTWELGLAATPDEIGATGGGHVLLKGGDPAAPSGTATLLRLRPSHQTRPRRLPPLRVSSATSIVLGFHDVTGGVYKARERIHRSMLTCGY